MSFEVKQLGDESIIIVTITPPTDLHKDPQQTLEVVNAMARRIQGPVYRISDVSRLDITLDMLIAGLAADVRYSEPNVRHIVVGKGEMVELIAQAIKQPQYGAQEGHMVASVEEGIALARKLLQG
ncbi:MAG: hypothetical protein U0670_10115 [Anaerolineae bacterium]